MKTQVAVSQDYDIWMLSIEMTHYRENVKNVPVSYSSHILANLLFAHIIVIDLPAQLASLRCIEVFPCFKHLLQLVDLLGYIE